MKRKTANRHVLFRVVRESKIATSLDASLKLILYISAMFMKAVTLPIYPRHDVRFKRRVLMEVITLLLWPTKMMCSSDNCPLKGHKTCSLTEMKPIFRLFCEAIRAICVLGLMCHFPLLLPRMICTPLFCWKN